MRNFCLRPQSKYRAATTASIFYISIRDTRFSVRVQSVHNCSWTFEIVQNIELLKARASVISYPIKSSVLRWDANMSTCWGYLWAASRNSNNTNSHLSSGKARKATTAMAGTTWLWCISMLPPFLLPLNKPKGCLSWRQESKFTALPCPPAFVYSCFTTLLRDAWQMKTTPTNVLPISQALVAQDHFPSSAFSILRWKTRQKACCNSSQF